MKILFLRRRCEGLVGAPGKYHEFEQEVGKLSECRWAGELWPSHKPNENMTETVKRVMPDTEWVFDRDDGFELPSKREYKVGAFISDLHRKVNKGVGTPRGFVNLINASGYDAVFLKYLSIHGTQEHPDLFLRFLKPKIHFLPWSVNPDKFKPLEKTIDVAFLGTVAGSVYPLRSSLWAGLPTFCSERGLRLLMRQPPKESGHRGKLGFRKVSKYRGDPRYVVGGEYEKALGRTKFFIFGCSRFRYLLQKYVDALSSGCTVFADKPSEAEVFGLVDKETYVEINTKNWQGKLDYYLKHPDEAEQIARKGRELVLRRHTHKIRAKEFLNALI